MSNFLQDLLNLYLLPFMLAVPLAIVVLLVTTRRGDQPTDEPAPPASSEAGRRPAHSAATPAARSAAARGVAEAAPLAAAAVAAAAQARPAAAIVAATAAAKMAAAMPEPPDTAPVPHFEPTQPAPWLSQPTPAHAVLVVDDSAVARAKLRKLFESAGYRVEVARDGVEALERLAESGYSVLITDLEMPNMDGVELIAAVQGSIATEDLPIIAITGHESLQARVQDCEGLYGIFKKPWHDRELLKRVGTLAAMRRPTVAAS